MEPQQVFRAYDEPTDAVNDLVLPRFCARCGGPCEQQSVEGGVRARCGRCGFMHYKNPQPAIAVLIVESDRFVLGKRISTSLQHGLWCLPCGYVEYHEDYLSAAVREVKEETNLDINIRSIVSVVTNYLKPEVHSLVTVLMAERSGGELIAGDGMAEVRWFPYTGQFPAMAFAADAHIISRYFETRLAGAPVDPRYAG